VRTTVATGHHELLLRLPGHQDQYHQLRVEPAGEASIDVSLAARVPVLRPGTRRGLVSVGLGAALGVSGAAHAGQVDITVARSITLEPGSLRTLAVRLEKR
jgi:hypothetical protein